MVNRNAAVDARVALGAQRMQTSGSYCGRVVRLGSDSTHSSVPARLSGVRRIPMSGIERKSRRLLLAGCGSWQSTLSRVSRVQIFGMGAVISTLAAVG